MNDDEFAVKVKIKGRRDRIVWEVEMECVDSSDARRELAQFRDEPAADHCFPTLHRIVSSILDAYK